MFQLIRIDLVLLSAFSGRQGIDNIRFDLVDPLVGNVGVDDQARAFRLAVMKERTDTVGGHGKCPHGKAKLNRLRRHDPPQLEYG